MLVRDLTILGSLAQTWASQGGEAPRLQVTSRKSISERDRADSKVGQAINRATAAKSGATETEGANEKETETGRGWRWRYPGFWKTAGRSKVWGSRWRTACFQKDTESPWTGQGGITKLTALIQRDTDITDTCILLFKGSGAKDKGGACEWFGRGREHETTQSIAQTKNTKHECIRAQSPGRWATTRDYHV